MYLLAEFSAFFPIAQFTCREKLIKACFPTKARMSDEERTYKEVEYQKKKSSSTVQIQHTVFVVMGSTKQDVHERTLPLIAVRTKNDFSQAQIHCSL